MIRLSQTVAMLAVLLCVPGIAEASSSDWFETEGGRVRLVTAGTPDATGRLHGVLDIELDRGWKTYWRDPGGAGVPPTIDISKSSNIRSAVLDFPAPQRHKDDGFSWAGYDRSVGFPVTFELADASEPAKIEAGIFLGVCETICIPVKVDLTVLPQGDPDNRADAAAVAVARAALPAPATAEFGIRTVDVVDDVLTVEATAPGGADQAELFVASDTAYTVNAPVRAAKSGRTLFSMKVSRPATAPAGGGLHYTLVTPHGAVSGLLPYF